MIHRLAVAILLASAMGLGPSSRPVVRIDVLNGRSVDAQLLSIDSAGGVRLDPPYPGSLSLEDVRRISPIRMSRPKVDELPIRQHFHLAGGEQLTGQLLQSVADKPRVLRVECGLPKALDLPLEALAGIRFAGQEHAAAQQELETRLATRPKDKDLLIVIKENKPVVVSGALERLGPDGFEFTIGRKLQKAGLESAYAVVLGGATAAGGTSPANIRLLGGSELPGRIGGADEDRIRLDAGLLGSIEAPWDVVEEIRIRSGRVVYLSDMRPLSIETKSVLDVAFPPKLDRSVEGGVLSMRGRSYEKGIGVHATCAMSFELGGAYERFIAAVGVDDSASPHGSVVARVVGDGKELFKSEVIRGDQAPVPVSVDVSGVKRLTLETGDGGDLDVSDHADWADAMLLKARGQAVR